MKFTLQITLHNFPTRTAFTISRSTVTHVAVIQVELSDGTHMGRGECRPYPRYNQTPESVTAELESVRTLIETGQMDKALESLQDKSAARNALSSAWLEYSAKATNKTAAQLLDVTPPKPRETAFTLSWGSVGSMVTAAKQAADYPWLKIKIGEAGLEQVLAVAKARPDARLIIDANEALSSETLASFLGRLSGLNIASIDDLDRLWQLGYRAVNVKLDKCGGPLKARDLILRAKDMGFTIMAGCMVGSSLAMAPMMTLESLCDVIDLDGALLLAEDVDHGLNYDGAIVHPPSKALWG